MSLLDLLNRASVWEEFYAYKASLASPQRFTRELRLFIDEKRYLPVLERLRAGEPFPLPKKSVISKLGSEKKRIVYTYPGDENTVLKLLTYLLLRRYDALFCDSLYSFRPGRTAKDAIRFLLRTEDRKSKYVYKADIHDYFNATPVERLLPRLEEALGEDRELYCFLSALLREESVMDRGKVIREKKGMMAGTPLSSFYANLYLSGMDRHFRDEGILYARYSDDVILFADSEKQRQEAEEWIASYLAEEGLELNPKKEEHKDPGEGFTFLGFTCSGDCVDIAPATVKKLKQKMRRKRDALSRWQKRSEAEPERTAKAFIRVFNRKLLESAGDHELSWSQWFFPVISTTQSLHEIDLYAQDCLRYLLTGKHTKARFNTRYDDLKKLGYRSLVNAYYKHEAERKKDKE